jgi:hypothetical protein
MMGQQLLFSGGSRRPVIVGSSSNNASLNLNYIGAGVIASIKPKDIAVAIPVGYSNGTGGPEPPWEEQEIPTSMTAVSTDWRLGFYRQDALNITAGAFNRVFAENTAPPLGTNSGTNKALNITVFRNAAIDQIGTAILRSSGTDSSFALPGVTVTRANSILVAVISRVQGINTTGELVKPASMTIIPGSLPASESYIFSIRAYYEIVGAGATGTRSFTWNGPTTSNPLPVSGIMYSIKGA